MHICKYLKNKLSSEKFTLHYFEWVGFDTADEMCISGSRRHLKRCIKNQLYMLGVSNVEKREVLSQIETGFAYLDNKRWYLSHKVSMRKFDS